MALDRETYFKSLSDLFEMPGWKILLDELNASIAQSQRAGADAPDWGLVQFFKGRRTAFEELATLPATIVQHQEALIEAETDYADL